MFAEELKPETNTQVLNVILESLFVIAEKIQTYEPNSLNGFMDLLHNKGIVEKIEELQTHSNTNIYKKSYKFITKFLETEAEL
jgi:hypothetical protein